MRPEPPGQRAVRRRAGRYLVPVLAGRDSERAAVVALLHSARAGAGGALVLHGLPGVGKTALLATAANDAPGMTLLHTRGIESESPLAFAALHRLLRPVLHLTDRLPGPQSRALRAAFGEADDAGADRFLVFLAALSLVSAAAEDTPVLAVVDDAHWLDDASAAALLFVARRLQDEKIAALFGARDGDERTFDAGDLPQLELTGIDEAAAADLLAGRSGAPVPAGVRDRLVRSTGGNPLALVELAAALSTAQLAGLEPLPAELPLTAGVERAFLDRYRRLPDGARTFLLVAAADDSGRLAVVQQAARALGATADAQDEVERSGLLRVVSGQLELRHPLVRSAVYSAATSRQRRQTHSALAAVLTGPEQADRRAWHRAAAADEPDESVVELPDAAARRARSRGGLEAAAAAWERAAELTRDTEARTLRLYAAARVAWLAGRPSWARRLVDTAIPGADEPGLRADMIRLRARIEWNTGSLAHAHRMIMEGAAAVAQHDVDRAREMAMFGAAVASFGGDSGVGVDPVPLAFAEAADTARTRCFADLLLGLAHVRAGDWSAAAPLLRAASSLTETLSDEDQDLLPNLGIGALHLGDDDGVRRHHEMLLARARGSGAMVMVLYALNRRIFADVATGRWREAEAAAIEALDVAASLGQPGLGAMSQSWLVLLAALRGQESFAERLARAEATVAAHPTGILGAVIDDVLRWAKAVDAAARPDAALHHLELVRQGVVQRLAAVDRVEAAVRAGHPETAASWVSELEDFAAATGQSWPAAAAAHGRALLAESPDAERLFARAHALHADSPRTFDRARTELAHGEFLRRARRRVDARVHLRAAIEVFDDLGATPWRDRAAAELRASGETARRREGARVPAAELTPQERQVAKLVSEGLTNRDVAAQLFLSPRTIDFHLRNVFGKLGVASRAELARLPLA
ncbi:AAA family ATPase [Georgenia yuyongxinii]|uniref:helix-turn-helix transcriptional regulator n=1 Tax=Georgenia yuyongxinii TaxID=2589797 RepID=UPI00362A2821